MPKIMQDLIKQYVEAVKKIYGSHVRQIILYGSYARGDFRPDSDVDIMILVDISDLELKTYAQQLSYMTYGIHGALCYSYSGMCLFSSMLGGRSGNRGRCAQPCRLPYEVYDGEKRLGSKKEEYPLSPKDMCTIDILPEILDAGVYSLKIEGRMKKPEYAAGVTRIYRKYLDLYKENPKSFRVLDSDRQELLRK